jgi:chloramphenicol 3-O phosphotransferase
MKGKIIFLNGASSSGKTTLARALQARLERPAYHLAYDTFSQMASKAHRM